MPISRSVTEVVTPNFWNTKFADISCYLDLFSLWQNKLGPEGGVAIAEALKINKTITNIE